MKFQKYDNALFNHAATITGIKNYFSKDDIVQFEVYDPFPYWLITETPLYSKLKIDGYNILNQQAIPYIGHFIAEPWYLIEESDLIAAKEIKNVSP